MDQKECDPSYKAKYHIIKTGPLLIRPSVWNSHGEMKILPRHHRDTPEGLDAAPARGLSLFRYDPFSSWGL